MLAKNLLLSLAVAAPVVLADQLPLRLVSFNIRLATSVPGVNEKPWAERAPYVVDQLNKTALDPPCGAPTLIGMQEVFHVQLTDIKEGLGAGWGHIGVGRDDGKEKGEYSPIVYRTDVLRVLYNETKWLSTTPDVPSFGWGATNRRIVTLGVFEHIETGKKFIASNTHLDHQVSKARTESVKVIMERIIAAQEEYGPLGVSLTGDFNSEPDGDAHSTVMSFGYLEDLHDLTSDRKGPETTYTGFVPGTKETRIDYVFVGPKEDKKWKVNGYEVLDNVVDDIYISDHRAVVGDVTLVD
ncbi:related to endonuclease/exonuclease/phosphatase family protein [Cephalotrichum gorgonifer]|uniref:Related to endonuclease/exonuclease/phosphatase family protein n=1 Tax=Cephalotrichum gorgonifer TaxID=2041049 RepID=A0AAE8MZ21_9PEZI|nr:related to endonuclease/exonuclease/phosphatase family protein [Cephalotrichum gorgonifer]